MRLDPSSLLRTAALLLLAALPACDRAPFGAEAGAPNVALAFQASVASAPEVDLIVVEVSGPGIAVPILGNFPVADGRAEGTLRVPAGNDRVFSARGFDGRGAVTHEGSVTRDVRPNGPPVQIPLPPRGVGVPIVVSLGGYLVAIEPADPALAPPYGVGVGRTIAFHAVVRDAEGNPITADPADLVWGSTNPAIVRVQKDVEGRGEVTGFLEGTAGIGVSFRGVAARVEVTVVDGIVAATVSAGIGHTCGLTISGTAYCWGNNVEGQVGDGTTTDRLVPTAVSGAHGFVFIDAGDAHTCAIRSDGAAFCWGWNPDGQIGDGTMINRSAPTAVGGSHVFASLSAGANHTCGVRTDGTTYCWGNNVEGQLGDGTTTNRLVPTAVGGSHAFASISAGAAHTCGVRTDDTAVCWGFNLFGSLGDGTTTRRLLPTAVSGSHSFASLSAGTLHTCGIRTDDAALCWGLGSEGRLGDGATVNRTVPTPVSGSHGFASLSAGRAHTCGVRIDDSAFCWGSNVAGQLGDGTTINRTVPTPVGGSHGFASISTGGAHTCGIDGGGGALCWGSNEWGRLGDGTTTSRAVPTPVSGWLSLP